MSKVVSGQKRSMGKKSPLSKRPKLDFSRSIVESPVTNKSKDSSNGYFGSSKQVEVNHENWRNAKSTTSTDWDDDFSGDMLEKVCMIADLSQAMVNNEQTAVEAEDDLIRTCKSTIVGPRDQPISDDIEEVKLLKLKNEKLLENFKTKEGEVQILRSQLKQQQEAKQAESVHNSKAIEEMKRKYLEKIANTEKECESMKTKLQFKDLEVKSLTERCKQLESSTSKIKLVEPEAMHIDTRKSHFLPSQAVSTQITKLNGCENEDIFMDFENHSEEKDHIISSFPENICHEGKRLADLISPEFFRFIKEPSIVPLYTFHNGSSCYTSSLDFDKREKYKWSGLPEQTAFVKDMYDVVSNLFSFEDFSKKNVKTVIGKILDMSMTILNFQRDIFLFLEKFQQSDSEYDDSDQSLLEYEEKANTITLKNILDGVKIRGEECGLEARRSLGLVLSLIRASKSVLIILVNEKTSFLNVMKELASSVGNLRRPLRYTGLLVAITLVVREILSLENLKADVLATTREIIEEIIFSRPKLDVLLEVVMTLQNGAKHLNFLSALCRKASVESCALYMDSKLRQAMFFTKDTCPLKLLCMQVMGLSFLPSSRAIRCDVTNSFVKWLNLAMDADHNRIVKWLPSSLSLESDDRCFDVTECLTYLLNLCVTDWKTHFGCLMGTKLESAERKVLTATIGRGALLFKRIIKTDQRLLQDSMQNLRFATDIKILATSLELTAVQLEAVSWVTELLENDIRNQESCAKPNASPITDREIIEALTITDDVKIF